MVTERGPAPRSSAAGSPPSRMRASKSTPFTSAATSQSKRERLPGRKTAFSAVGDVPPTGRFVKVDYIHLLRYREGKHVSFNLMFDRLTMLEQLGLAPAPALAA